MKKYAVETWETEKLIATFDLERERGTWMEENCTICEDGTYYHTKEEGAIRICFYEFEEKITIDEYLQNAREKIVEIEKNIDKYDTKSLVEAREEIKGTFVRESLMSHENIAKCEREI